MEIKALLKTKTFVILVMTKKHTINIKLYQKYYLLVSVIVNQQLQYQRIIEVVDVFRVNLHQITHTHFC